MKRKIKFYVWFNYLAALALVLSLMLFSLRTLSISPNTLSQANKEPMTELRGVWLTNVASDILFTPWAIARSLTTLAQLNFNTVYPVVWNRGYTFYESQVAQRITGSSQQPLINLMRGGSDVLSNIIQQAQQRGLSVIPWFEYGLVIPAHSEIAKNYPYWLTASRDGTITRTYEGLEAELNTESSNITTKQDQKNILKAIPTKDFRQQSWLNPTHPEVKKFITDLMLEVVTNYDVQGIQIDDHFAMPVELGYDAYTVNLYQQEHAGKSPPDNAHDPEWMRWRAAKITQLMTEIAQKIREVKPDIKISLSPNPYSFAYRNYLQDWHTWVKKGLIDEVVLQVYRDDLAKFSQELAEPELQQIRKLIPVSIAIFTGNSSNPIALKQIENQVKITRDRKFAGVSFFYWESLWGYITPESPRQRRQGFQALFPQPANATLLTAK